jgi:uncharacterized RDD family membrane protein YckC
MPVVASSAPGVPPPYAPTEVAFGPLPPRAEPRYAGFWRRFWAVFIDGMVLNAVLFPLGLALSITTLPHLSDQDLDPGAMTGVMTAYLRLAFLATVINWIYASLMESSARQATLGKMVLGIRVTDLDGKRLSFARATGRYFGKMVSGLTLMIGYLVQVVTARRQALHDVLAGTLVVRSGG